MSKCLKKKIYPKIFGPKYVHDGLIKSLKTQVVTKGANSPPIPKLVWCIKKKREGKLMRGTKKMRVKKVQT